MQSRFCGMDCGFPLHADWNAALHILGSCDLPVARGTGAAARRGALPLGTPMTRERDMLKSVYSCIQVPKITALVEPGPLGSSRYFNPALNGQGSGTCPGCRADSLDPAAGAYQQVAQKSAQPRYGLCALYREFPHTMRLFRLLDTFQKQLLPYQQVQIVHNAIHPTFPYESTLGVWILEITKVGQWRISPVATGPWT